MTTQHPLVSVITIFKNEERFLPESVESVLEQSTDRWELLLVDDGSEDDSSGIARRYAREHAGRIRYLTHPGRRNLGKSASRNLGLREATAPYVTFLDADDVFLPQKVECQAGLLEATEATMVYGRTLYWRNWTGSTGSSGPDTLSRTGVSPGAIYAPPVLLERFLRDPGTVPCICALTVRRDAALSVGGFDERVSYLFEDQVFLAKICLRYPVYVDAGCWDLYRQHEHSTSRQAIIDGQYHPTRPNASHHAYLSWLARYLDQTGRDDEMLRRALLSATRPYRYPVFYRWLGRIQRRTRRVLRAARRRGRGPERSRPGTRNAV